LVLDRVLFSELTPWVMFGLAFLLPSCISLPLIRSVKPLRKLLWAGCAFALMIGGAIGYLAYVYVGSGSEDTVALAVQDGVVVAADRRRTRTLYERRRRGLGFKTTCCGST
jgi:hypothetical protein